MNATTPCGGDAWRFTFTVEPGSPEYEFSVTQGCGSCDNWSLPNSRGHQQGGKCLGWDGFAFARAAGIELEGAR